MRWLGTSTIDGRPHDVVSYQTFDGRLASLSFDAGTHLLSQIEYLFVDPIVGDSVTGVRFGGYAAAGGTAAGAGAMRLPRWREQFRGSDWVIKTDYVDVAVNRELPATAFEMPADYELRPTPPTPTVRLEKVGDGVHLLSGLGTGGRYNVLVVEFRDHLVVVNAPTPASASQRALDELTRAFPSQPVTLVVLTHPAYDHIGGVRAFVAAGATVMTTATTRPMVERALAAPMRLEPDALARLPKPPPTRFEIVRGQLVLGDQRLVLLDIGPHELGDEVLVAYAPAARLLFQADVVNPNYAGAYGVAQPTEVHLDTFLSTRGLAVDRIAGGHGGIIDRRVLREMTSR